MPLTLADVVSEDALGVVHDGEVIDVVTGWPNQPPHGPDDMPITWLANLDGEFVTVLTSLPGVNGTDASTLITGAFAGRGGVTTGAGGGGATVYPAGLTATTLTTGGGAGCTG
jgi:hypothetical protein